MGFIKELWERNRKIIDGHGTWDHLFASEHEDGSIWYLYAQSQKHAEILRRIDYNLNWCPKVIKVYQVQLSLLFKDR